MSDVETLFDLCDTEKKGYLVEQDLVRVCPQFVKKDIEFIFRQLDSDGSGRIEKEEFVKGFENVVNQGEHSLNGMQRRASVRKRANEEEVFASDPETATSRPTITLDDDVYLSESDTNTSIDFSVPCQDEVLLLYEQLQSTGMPQLLRKFEKVVGSFYKEIREKTHENELLQHIYASEKEMYNKRMEEVDAEIDQQLEMAEQKARTQERERLTKEKEEMKERMNEEMKEMRENIERLQKMERVLLRESENLKQQKEISAKFEEVNEENYELRKNLAENHLELAMIKSELAHIRSNYDEKQNELLRRKDQISTVSKDSETVRRQLQLLFDANKKLHETNESLRDVLDNRAAVIKQFNLRSTSPYDLTPTDGIDAQSSFPQVPRVFSPVEVHAVGAADTSLILDDSGVSINDRSADNKLVGIHEANGPAERTFRIVMCGDAAVGKSSIVMRVIRRQFTNQLPSTLGVDFHVKTVNVDGHNVALQLWDTAGQERFRSLCKSYFRRADGAILVYDVTAEQSFLRVREWVNTIKESVERSIPIILIGNKCDLRHSDHGNVTKSDGSSMAAAMGVLFMETSALDGSNIDNSVLALTRELMAVEEVEIRSTGVILTEREKKEKSGCFSKCRGS